MFIYRFFKTYPGRKALVLPKIITGSADIFITEEEIDEVQKHVRRKGIDVLGGKDSEAYKDSSIRGQVYSDIYNRLKREFGCVSTYKSIKRKYLADVHDFIDCYMLPMALAEQISNANSQMRFSA